jgi:hypothetical protein
MEDTLDPLAESRAKLLTESLDISNEPRWGYFGMPGALCIGDNSYAPQATRRLQTEGDGDEAIRNVQVAPLKKGRGPDVYFGFAPPLCRDDPYVDPYTLTRPGKVTMWIQKRPSGPLECRSVQ